MYWSSLWLFKVFPISTVTCHVSSKVTHFELAELKKSKQYFVTKKDSAILVDYSNTFQNLHKCQFHVICMQITIKNASLTHHIML